MTVTEFWANFFSSIGVNYLPIPGNEKALQLTNVAGCPVFRSVANTSELNDLHMKARAKSSEMKKLLVLGMPVKHPSILASMPGDLFLPKFRVYGGHTADTFSLHGHQIEPKFLKSIKAEVLAVMKGGTRAKTPLCDWIQGLLGTNWHYGTPSSLAQLDSMLGLISRDVSRIGHVRARQLSFGRGCADALLVPENGIKLKTNGLTQAVLPSDLRFISLEHENSMYDPSRARIYPVFSHKFLSGVAQLDKEYAKDLGAGQNVGSSAVGSLEKMKVKSVDGIVELA